MAPEVNSFEDYDQAADVFCYGMLGDELEPVTKFIQAMLQRCMGPAAHRPTFDEISNRFRFEAQTANLPCSGQTLSDRDAVGPARRQRERSVFTL